jgi:hypothetical protein
VSILDRFRLSGHLNDEALAAIWTDRALDGAPVTHPHVQTCSACRARLAALDSWLGDLRLDAIGEADEAFPAERLAAQQSQVIRRLEAAERPARVIAFPKFTRPLTSGSSHLRRWVTAAAAAGLFVGVGLGQIMDLRHANPIADRGVPARLEPQPAALSAAVVAASATPQDDTFLNDLDASFTRFTVPDSLRALDEFTPRAGEPPR